MTNPISNRPAAPSVPQSATVDNLIQSEHFDSNSKAVKTGGQASLINVQKDVDSLMRTQGKAVTKDDLKKDLVATGLSADDADKDATSLIAAAASGNTGELQNELAGLFHSQGGLDVDHAQGLANQFISMVNTGSDTVATYQSHDQFVHSGVSAAFSSNTNNG